MESRVKLDNDDETYSCDSQRNVATTRKFQLVENSSEWKIKQDNCKINYALFSRKSVGQLG